MCRRFLTVLSLIVAAFECYSAQKQSPGSPVILVPGDGGSQFEAQLNKTRTSHVWCTQSTKKWFSLWLNLELMAPFALDCLVDNMRLVYDNVTRTTSNSPGVQIRQPNFGNTSSVEWLDPSEIGATSYYYHLVEALVAKGYTRNLNIRGAPYDFRKAPNEMQHFLKNLAALVEETYHQNNKQKVVLVGHSMGNPYLLNMLNRQTQRWKDTYVKSYVSLAAPWGGAVKTLRLMASGDNLGVVVVNPLTARPEQRSMPSSAWLMPYDTFWNESEVLVTSPTGNYTVKDYKRFFNDIKYPNGYLMREDTEPLGLKQLVAPGVEVHCLHGIDVDTPASFHYSKKDWFSDQPDVVYGQGDGTVNVRSLHGCLRWRGKNKSKKILNKGFPKVDHMHILKDADVAQYLLSVLYS